MQAISPMDNQELKWSSFYDQCPSFLESLTVRNVNDEEARVAVCPHGRLSPRVELKTIRNQNRQEEPKRSFQTGLSDRDEVAEAPC